MKLIELKNIFSYKTLYWAYILILGFVFIFLVPPFQKADEVYHYFNVYGVTQKGSCNFTVGSMDLPIDIVNFSEKMKSESIAFQYRNKFPKSVLNSLYILTHDEKTLYKRSCVKFSVLSYLPNIIGIKAGGNNLLHAFYLSRLFGFLFFLISVFISLKLSGRYSPIIIAFSIIPMVIHQVSSISYDSFHISLGLFLLSFYIYLINNFSKTKLYMMYMYIFYILILVFTLGKGGYYLLLALPILFPSYPLFKNKFRNILFKYLFLIFYFLIAFCLIKNSFTYADNPQNGLVNSLLQKRIILEDPLYYIKVLSKTTSDNFYFYWTSFLGTFGWLDYGTQFSIYLLETFYILYFISKIKFNSVKKNKFKINDFFELFFIFGIAIGTYIIVQTALYLVWTPLAEKIVIGVQGRYLFIPFLFLIYGLVRFVEIFGIKISNIIFTIFTFILVIFNITKSVYLRYYDYSSTYSNLNELDLSNYKDFKKNNSRYKVVPIVDNITCENIGDNKIGGFAIYFTNNVKENEYIKDVFKYEIFSGEKIFHSGYLDQTKIQIEGQYLEEFKKIIENKEGNILCLRLYKKYSQDSNNTILSYIEDNGVSAKFLIISK